MRLSACIVVKNEATTLQSTLESVRGYADEIVVVDGGSTDDSVQVAQAKGARVFVDLGDVSAARNRALLEARGGHCLMIDGDEVARAATWDALWAFIAEGLYPRGRILQVSETSNGIASVWVTRVCVNDRTFRYEGSIHEQLVGPGRVANCGLVVDHSGYSPASLARKKTVARNLRLLEAELVNKPTDPYLHYQLGKTHFVAEEHARAVPSFEAALSLVPRDASYRSALVCDLAYALKGSGRPDRALTLVREAQSVYPDYTDLWFLEGLCHMATGDVPGMLGAFRHCLVLGEAPSYATVEGVGSYRAHYNLGLFHELSGDAGAARSEYEHALAACPSFTLAADRLRALPHA